MEHWSEDAMETCGPPWEREWWKTGHLRPKRKTQQMIRISRRDTPSPLPHPTPIRGEAGGVLAGRRPRLPPLGVSEPPHQLGSDSREPGGNSTLAEERLAWLSPSLSGQGPRTESGWVTAPPCGQSWPHSQDDSRAQQALLNGILFEGKYSIVH